MFEEDEISNGCFVPLQIKTFFIREFLDLSLHLHTPINIKIVQNSGIQINKSFSLDISSISSKEVLTLQD